MEPITPRVLVSLTASHPPKLATIKALHQMVLHLLASQTPQILSPSPSEDPMDRSSDPAPLIVYAREGETVEVRWTCTDGTPYTEEYRVPPKATREARRGARAGGSVDPVGMTR